jgi:predicted ester cyclase
MASNLELARHYIRAVEEGATGEDLARYLDPGVIAHWYPNRLDRKGRSCDLAAMLESAERGKKIVARQSYGIENAVADGDRVALEVTWVGTVEVPVGTLPAGSEMRAHFAVFLEFRNGKIVRQRNYDCFDPW